MKQKEYKVDAHLRHALEIRPDGRAPAILEVDSSWQPPSELEVTYRMDRFVSCMLTKDLVETLESDPGVIWMESSR